MEQTDCKTKETNNRVRHDAGIRNLKIRSKTECNFQAGIGHARKVALANSINSKKRKTMKQYFLITIFFFSMYLSAAADNWPQWRGPDGTSVAGKGNFPTEFSSTENVLWKVKLPGPGSSTPVVWEDKIFVTGGSEGQDSVQAYDWKGGLVWQKTLGPERPGKHQNGSGSNSSPITDGKNVYVYFKSGTVASLTLNGKLNWQINLQKKFGEDTLWWDLGTSPVLAGGNVVVAVMQEGESYVVAIKPEDGSVAWKADRTFPVQSESGQSYTTPLVREIDGQETIVIWGADRLTGHDPKDGKILWTCEGFNPEDKAMWRRDCLTRDHGGRRSNSVWTNQVLRRSETGGQR